MEFDEIIVKESPGLCRCCLSEGCYKDMGTEYAWMNENEVYADMLLECFDISISQLNDGPNGPNRLICEVCITRLRDACYFKKQVLESEKKFIDMVGRGEFKSKAILVSLANMKAETADDDDAASFGTDDADPEYLDDEIEYLEEDILKAETQEPGVSDVTADPLPVRGKRGRPRKDPVKADKKKVKTEPKPKSSKPVLKDEFTPAPYEGCASEHRRKNLKILFNNTTVLPFKWRGRFLCCYCPNTYTEYTEFKKHTISHGTCTTKDYSLEAIKGNHIEIKLDVSEICCELCNEPFGNLDEIIQHLIGKHNLEYDNSVDIPYQVYRLVDMRCLFCEEQFTYFGYLISHVNVAHPQNCFICDDCGVTFNKKRDLAVHFRYYHRPGGYNCDQCPKNFENFYLLRTHRNTVHYRKCKNCNLRFVSLALLQKHILLEHPNDGSLKCEFCAKHFRSQQGLKQHLLEHPNYGSLKCEFCAKHFRSQQGLKQHILLEHPNDGSLKCEFCAKQFRSRQGLKQHESKCKVILIVSVDESTDKFFTTDDNFEPKKKQNLKRIRQNIQCVLNMSTAVPFKFFSIFSCFYCAKKFVNFDELRNHTGLEHPVCDLKSKSMRRCQGERVSVKIDINSLNCKVCCQRMDNLNTLIDHLVSEHKADYDKSVKGCLEPFRIMKDSIPCPQCPDRVFRYFSMLQRHINSEHNNNNWICDFCGCSFKSVVNLNAHISNTHTGSCECSICGVKYKNQLCLARHRAKCHNAKDYKCSKCPEQFQSEYQTQKHLIKMHNIGHKCDQCGKMFTRNSFMKNHVRRTHLKEKNVICSVCNEKFFDNYLLKLHMMRHEGVRRFSCSVCGKAFLRRSYLNTHMKMHKK